MSDHQDDIARLCGIASAAVFQPHGTVFDQHQKQVVHIFPADLVPALAVIMAAEVDVVQQAAGRRSDRIEKDLRAGYDTGFVLTQHVLASRNLLLYHISQYSTILLSDKYF